MDREELIDNVIDKRLNALEEASISPASATDLIIEWKNELEQIDDESLLSEANKEWYIFFNRNTTHLMYYGEKV